MEFLIAEGYDQLGEDEKEVFYFNKFFCWLLHDYFLYFLTFNCVWFKVTDVLDLNLWLASWVHEAVAFFKISYLFRLSQNFPKIIWINIQFKFHVELASETRAILQAYIKKWYKVDWKIESNCWWRSPHPLNLELNSAPRNKLPTIPDAKLMQLSLIGTCYWYLKNKCRN